MTDFIPPDPTPEQKKLQEATHKLIEQMAKARNEWTDRVMQAILPDALYNMAKTNKGSDRMKVQRWMQANKIRFKEWPNCTEIVRGDEILGRFVATFKDKKLEIEASIHKDLTPQPESTKSGESAEDNPPVVPPESDSATDSPDKGGAS